MAGIKCKIFQIFYGKNLIKVIFEIFVYVDVAELKSQFELKFRNLAKV